MLVSAVHFKQQKVRRWWGVVIPLTFLHNVYTHSMPVSHPTLATLAAIKP